VSQAWLGSVNDLDHLLPLLRRFGSKADAASASGHSASIDQPQPPVANPVFQRGVMPVAGYSCPMRRPSRVRSRVLTDHEGVIGIAADSVRRARRHRVADTVGQAIPTQVTDLINGLRERTPQPRIVFHGQRRLGTPRAQPEQQARARRQPRSWWPAFCWCSAPGPPLPPTTTRRRWPRLARKLHSQGTDGTGGTLSRGRRSISSSTMIAEELLVTESQPTTHHHQFLNC